MEGRPASRRSMRLCSGAELSFWQTPLLEHQVIRRQIAEMSAKGRPDSVPTCTLFAEQINEGGIARG